MTEMKRQTELDILRLLATLAVITIHAVKISAPFGIALYTFFIKCAAQWHFTEKTQYIFMKLTEYGFGVYCIHALLNALIPAPQFFALPICASMLRVLVLYLLSLLCTWLIRKIPVVGKMIT